MRNVIYILLISEGNNKHTFNFLTCSPQRECHRTSTWRFSGSTSGDLRTFDGLECYTFEQCSVFRDRGKGQHHSSTLPARSLPSTIIYWILKSSSGFPQISWTFLSIFDSLELRSSHHIHSSKRRDSSSMFQMMAGLPRQYLIFCSGYNSDSQVNNKLVS